jgi:hypothetical protein
MCAASGAGAVRGRRDMSIQTPGIDAGSLAKRLRHAMVTMQNDDLSAPGSEKRSRHIERTDALLDAAEFLETLASSGRRQELSACSQISQ